MTEYPLQTPAHHLSQRLSRIILDGPESDLNLTANTQPALMAVSIAALRVVESEGAGSIDRWARLVAGHSLGEYTALTAARALGLADAARLLRLRGEAMQRAVPVGEGAMAAILGLGFDEVAALVAEAAGEETLAIANDNADGQVVISGHADAVERAVNLAKEKGAKRAVKLAVSAPFHCPLMGPAAEEMARALETTALNPPVVPVLANISIAPERDPDRIRELLVDQVTGMVRWRETMEQMAADGFEEVVEIGAGKVLSGLARRAGDWTVAQIGTAADVEIFLKRVN